MREQHTYRQTDIHTYIQTDRQTEPSYYIDESKDAIQEDEKVLMYLTKEHRKRKRFSVDLGR